MTRTAIALAALALTSPALADTATFYLSEVGTSYTGFIFPGDPRIGGHVTRTRIFVDLEVFAGADAADFDADIAFPLLADEGCTPVLSILGSDLGWTGSGLFRLVVDTEIHNGTFLQTLYGAATYPLDAVLLETSRIEMEYTPLATCGSADFNGDGDVGTDADIEAFFLCLAGTCCETCGSADFNNDGDVGTDADIEAFFRILAGGTC
jgi:hypothetical protein